MLTNIYGLFTKPPCLLQRHFNSIAVTIGGTAYRNQTSDGQFHRFSSFSRAKPLGPNDVLPTKLLNICNARPGTRLYHEAIWMFHIRWLASFIRCLFFLILIRYHYMLVPWTVRWLQFNFSLLFELFVFLLDHMHFWGLCYWMNSIFQ